MIIFLLTIITICLVLLTVALGMLWRKIDVYLTWNTRYDSVDYEQAVTTPKVKRTAQPASKTEQKGRSIKPISDLVDLSDLDFDTAVQAIESIGEGK